MIQKAENCKENKILMLLEKLLNKLKKEGYNRESVFSRLDLFVNEQKRGLLRINKREEK